MIHGILLREHRTIAGGISSSDPRLADHVRLRFCRLGETSLEIPAVQGGGSLAGKLSARISSIT
jgi:hypothetical protein